MRAGAGGGSRVSEGEWMAEEEVCLRGECGAGSDDGAEMGINV